MASRQTAHEIMNVTQVSDYLRTHRVTIYALLKQGEIPGFRLGGRGEWRFVRSEIESWCQKKMKIPRKKTSDAEWVLPTQLTPGGMREEVDSRVLSRPRAARKPTNK